MRRRFAFAFVMAVIGMVSDAVPCSGGQMPAWRIVGIPESAKMSSGSVSAARWIWTKASARPNQVVYFRYRFESGDITKGDIKPFLNCRADDFFSASYLNGFKFEFKDFCKYLRKGENVLALAVSNGVASAAVIFHGVCRGPDGKRRVLSSNASVNVRHP